MKTDTIRLAAEAYKKLTNIEYCIVLGRKGNMCELNIVFMADNFYHLSGFHKLKNSYPFQHDTSANVLKNILNQKLNLSKVEEDPNFNILKSRLHSLYIFENIMDSNKTLFYSYDPKKVSFPTKINAKYLAKGCTENSPITFSFFVKDDNKYCMNSIFPEGKYDYSSRQTQYTVLLKEKRIIDQDIEIELYRHSKYQE